MDTDPTPVRLLFPDYIHTLNDLRVQRCFFNFRDACGDPNEDRPFRLGEDPTGQRHYRHSSTSKTVLGLH